MATSSNLILEQLRISLQNAQQRRASILDETDAVKAEQEKVDAEFAVKLEKLARDRVNVEEEISQTQSVVELLESQLPKLSE